MSLIDCLDWGVISNISFRSKAFTPDIWTSLEDLDWREVERLMPMIIHYAVSPSQVASPDLYYHQPKVKVYLDDMSFSNSLKQD